MNIAFGLVLIAFGSFVLIRSHFLVRWLTHHSPWGLNVDTSTWRENTFIIGGLIVLAGLVFCIL